MGGGVPPESAKKKWQTKIPLLRSTTHDNDCGKALMKEHEDNPIMSASKAEMTD